ncbi:MAG: hypothetical protein JWM56_1364, partial [Candidatus Peribacteria bacterium]|nr:hypothetical protein [Candidatus Peribacteria bacterium]
MMTILISIGVLILLYAGVLGFFAWSRLQADFKRERDLVFLQILVPKKESKEDKEVQSEQFSGNDFREVLGVMDHMYQSLHSLYSGSFASRLHGQTFFSVEYAALAGEILLFVVCPRKIAHLMEKQLTSFYPDVIIDEVEDYNIFTSDSVVEATALVPQKPFTSVFKTYQQLKSDPLNSITNAFSKLKVDEGAAVQFILRPAKSGWQEKLQKEAKNLLNPKKKKASLMNPVTWLSSMFDLLTSPDDAIKAQSQEATGERVSQMIEEYSKGVDEKASNPGFTCTVRLLTSAASQSRAQNLLDGIKAAFSQFGDVRGNSFTSPPFRQQDKVVEQFIRRSPRRTVYQALRTPKMLLGTMELASFFHLPNIKYNKVESIKWQNFKVAPAPKSIPEEGLFLGQNTYRGEKQKIFMKQEDRFRHFYIIGQTGTGKSSIIQLMARQDFANGKGVCIVDPHGSLIEDVMPYIPRSRADDVIYFNPADTERPLGLNLLEGKTPEERDLIALDAMNMMVKMFGEEIFGPRIQDYFRNGCLTLMED